MSESHPHWFNPAVPAVDDSILPLVLARNAKAQPDRQCICFAGETSWTNAQLLEHTRRAAFELQQYGVKQGDNVLVWLPGNAAGIRAWFATNYLGAVFVPMNLDYRGAILQHVIKQSNASLMIAHPDLVSRLSEINTGNLKKVLVLSSAAKTTDVGIELVETTLEGSSENLLDKPATINLWDPQMVIFTSGTTGPSKGVVCSYLHLYTSGEGAYGYMTEDDCMLVELPLFHVGGVSPTITALNKQARIAMYTGFRTQEFWQRVEKNGATTLSGLVGSMAAFLAAAPPGAADKSNTLRMVSGHLDQQTIDLCRRYDFNFMSGFNMTELSVPLITEVNCQVPGTIGKPRTGCQVRVVDDNDYECPTNVIGELVIRCDQPWTILSGYLNQPEATGEAWRNGWFHTGDLARRDEHGNYFFVDRKKDCIRRRGENVSSVEVEAGILSHDAVAEVAVVGVASPHGEQDILAAVVLKEGRKLQPRELAEYLVPKMPHYMVPRYFRYLAGLPRTPTNKVRKVEIRDAGITNDCWDREAAGMLLKKTKLS